MQQILPGDSYFKRNVHSIISNLKKQLQQEKPVEEHVTKVLMNSEVGNKSCWLKLIYKYYLEVAEALADHNYSNVPLFDPTVIDIDLNKSTKIQSYIEKQYMHSSPEKGNTNITDEKTTTDKIIMQNELQINIVIFFMQFCPGTVTTHAESINSDLQRGLDRRLRRTQH